MPKEPFNHRLAFWTWKKHSGERSQWPWRALSLSLSFTRLGKKKSTHLLTETQETPLHTHLDKGKFNEVHIQRAHGYSKLLTRACITHTHAPRWKQHRHLAGIETPFCLHTSPSVVIPHAATKPPLKLRKQKHKRKGQQAVSIPLPPFLPFLHRSGTKCLPLPPTPLWKERDADRHGEKRKKSGRRGRKPRPLKSATEPWQKPPNLGVVFRPPFSSLHILPSLCLRECKGVKEGKNLTVTGRACVTVSKQKKRSVHSGGYVQFC